MRHMKKALSLLPAAAIVLPLAACGGNNGDGGQAGNRQASNNQLANGVNTAETVDEWVISQAGVTIVPAESWKSEDVYMALSGQELDDGITMVNVAMYAASEAKLEALSEQYSDDAEELQKQYDAIGYSLCSRSSACGTTSGRTISARGWTTQARETWISAWPSLVRPKAGAFIRWTVPMSTTPSRRRTRRSLWSKSSRTQTRSSLA